MANTQPTGPKAILLGVDGSKHSLAALHLLRDLPLSPNCSITALAVLIPRLAYDHSGLEAVLEHTQTLLADKDIEVFTELQLGYPSEVLLEYADTNRPNLIVLGAKGLRSTLGILLGGVAQQVVEYACCPVLVVRSPYTGVKRILMVTDGSSYSQEAVEFLAGFCLPENVEIILMHALPPVPTINLMAQSWPIAPDVLPPLPAEPDDELVIRQQEEEKVAGVMLDRTRATFDAVGITTSNVLLRGDAATEIINYAKENRIDLIVAGSRGLSQMQGWVLGSVSRKLVHYAHCSVLVVRTPPRPGEPVRRPSKLDSLV